LKALKDSCGVGNLISHYHYSGATKLFMVAKYSFYLPKPTGVNRFYEAIMQTEHAVNGALFKC
jgi:hypothetical protein